MSGRWVLLGLILGLTVRVPLSATELKPATVKGYDHYIALTEERMTSDQRKGNFLVIDALPADSRKKAYADLQRGNLFIQHTHTADDGHNIAIPDGLTHHWVGIVFIPGVNLVQTLSFLQDADHYQDIFQPAVRRSHLISWGENEMKISEQFYHKTIVTIAVNVEFDAHYDFVDSNHLVCRAHSTRAAEVEHVGQTDEHELPVGNDHGYLWRMNTYWHIEQKDGGVYLQVETIALTRPVPVALEWIVAPLVKSIPRGTMSTFLTTTRSQVTTRQANNATTPENTHPLPVADSSRSSAGEGSRQ